MIDSMVSLLPRLTNGSVQADADARISHRMFGCRSWWRGMCRLCGGHGAFPDRTDQCWDCVGKVGLVDESSRWLRGLALRFQWPTAPQVASTLLLTDDGGGHRSEHERADATWRSLFSCCSTQTTDTPLRTETR